MSNLIKVKSATGKTNIIFQKLARSVVFFRTSVFSLIIVSAILGGCAPNISEEERVFNEAVEQLGIENLDEISEQSYAVIDIAFFFFEKINFTRQAEIKDSPTRPYDTLMRSNMKLVEILANNLPDSREIKSPRDGSFYAGASSFFSNDENRAIVKKVVTACNRLLNTTYWDELDEDMVSNIYSLNVTLSDYQKKLTSSHSSNTSSDDSWACEILREQYGTDDISKVQEMQRIDEWRGDQFYDRYGFFPGEY